MMNFFLPLTAERKAKVLQMHPSACPMRLGDQDGVLIEESLLASTLEALGARVKSEKESGFEGIKSLVLSFRRARSAERAPPPAATGFQISTSSWRGYHQEGITLAVREILLPAVKRDVCIHTPGKRYAEALRDGRFHIWVHSGCHPESRLATRAPATIWGIPLDSQDEHFTPSGRGQEIADHATAFVVAELVGDNLFVHCDLTRAGTVEELRIFRLVLHHCLDRMSSDPRECRARWRPLFIDECSKAVARTLMTKATASGPGKDAREIARELPKLVRRASAGEQKLLRGEVKLDGEALGAEYDGLLKIPKVKDVRADHEAILIHTHTLYCVDPRSGRRHEIGKFIIKLFTDGRADGVRWYNQTRLVDALKPDMHAPHVWANGSACLGNTKDIFPKLLAERQYAVAAQLAIEFVENANTDDPAGMYVSYWPRA